MISGRTKASIERDLEDVPNLGLSAENGFHLKPRGESWKKLFTNVDLSWMPAVKEVIGLERQIIVLHEQVVDHRAMGRYSNTIRNAHRVLELRQRIFQ